MTPQSAGFVPALGRVSSTLAYLGGLSTLRRVAVLTLVYFLVGVATLTPTSAEALFDAGGAARANLSAGTLSSPEAFACSARGSSALLYWDAPLSGVDATGYTVYRDGAFFASTEGLELAVPTQTNPRYTVISTVGNWESIPTQELRPNRCSK